MYRIVNHFSSKIITKIQLPAVFDLSLLFKKVLNLSLHGVIYYVPRSIKEHITFITKVYHG
ncbi:hypothetical protein SeSPA_A2373 [Salmonella enterica subsp. enterica serovar Saintpaul str. SARA23]|nr:hypothetical protein SeSPA_A2373 [Salmonella enterica subsp. enterica serovar Saintpaul str. SARA23]